MTNDNVQLIRNAYEAYARGDMDTMLGFVDPDLEWTYLDPALVRPRPQVCHGRGELESRLRAWADYGFKAELEEIEGHGERVMVTVHTPGIDAHRAKQADDRNYSVFTVRDGRIVALRDCRNRGEALRIASAGT